MRLGGERCQTNFFGEFGGAITDHVTSDEGDFSDKNFMESVAI